MNHTAVLLDFDDGVATLTLNRPEARNAMSADMHRVLHDLVDQVAQDSAVRAVVLTGRGGAFCAGGDTKTIENAEPTFAEDQHRFDRVHELLYRLVELPKPVVAAVDGPAFGAGCNLALAADFILATPRARFCQVFGRIGLVPDFGGLFLLPRIVGLQRAKDLMFSARAVDAQEAQQLGIVYQVVPADDLQARAHALARRFCAASTVAIGMTKRALNRSFQADFHLMSHLEMSAQNRLRDDPYVRDAVARFNRKEALRFAWEDFESKGSAHDQR